jgi:hypothetical protein
METPRMDEREDYELTSRFLANLNRSVNTFQFVRIYGNRYSKYEKKDLKPINEKDLATEINYVIEAINNGRLSKQQRQKIRNMIEFILKNQEKRPIGRGEYNTDLVPKMLQKLLGILN